MERVEHSAGGSGVTSADWEWWAGQGGEHFTSGPHDSREAAVEAGKEEFPGEPFDICEAKQAPLKLSDWIDVDRIMQDAEDSIDESDRVCSDFDEPPYFPVTPEQEKDLTARIKRACDEWQAAHGLVFTVRTFSDARNHESIPAEETSEAAE
jgi:hypothetical protein